MTRFQASGPRIDYTPVERDRPFKQLVGLYNMWQSLGPDTRDWIANLFRKSGEVQSDAINPAIDTTLTYQEIPELGSKALWRAMMEQSTGMPIDWALTEKARPERYPAVGIDTSAMSPFGMSEDSTWLLK